MSMLYDIEPRDPIVIGDGRSIGQATMTGSLDLPFPSTVAGLLRTTVGRRADGGFETQRIPELLACGVTGPLLVRLEPDPEWYVPAPADAVFFEKERDPGSLVRMRISPRDPRDGEQTDLPAGLRLVGLDEDVQAKPRTGPRYWRWPRFEEWLQRPGDGAAPVDLGLGGLEHEERVHVVIDPDTRTAKDGALFRTDGVRFVTKARERLALRIGWDGPKAPSQVVSLGGERRLSTLTQAGVTSYPKPPKDLVGAIAKARRARIILLTPAIFDQGFRPSSIEGALLDACAVGRPVVVSGWDAAANEGRGAPKPTRRCAPAGSVYWLELDASVSDVGAWVERNWFKNVSSHAQDRRDGFGLAVVGVG